VDPTERPVHLRTSAQDPDTDAAGVARLLETVFARLEVPLTFRLWDGTEIHVGRGTSRCAVVLHSAAVARRLMLRPSMLNFGEAYIASDIDIEGDLFAAMDVGGYVEKMHVPLATRLRALPQVLRL